MSKSSIYGINHAECGEDIASAALSSRSLVPSDDMFKTPERIRDANGDVVEICGVNTGETASYRDGSTNHAEPTTAHKRGGDEVASYKDKNPVHERQSITKSARK